VNGAPVRVFGHEGGIEGLQVYMQPKFISHLG
jgi:hypothetical protein